MNFSPLALIIFRTLLWWRAVVCRFCPPYRLIQLYSGWLRHSSCGTLWRNSWLSWWRRPSGHLRLFVFIILRSAYRLTEIFISSCRLDLSFSYRTSAGCGRTVQTEPMAKPCWDTSRKIKKKILLSLHHLSKSSDYKTVQQTAERHVSISILQNSSERSETALKDGQPTEEN